MTPPRDASDRAPEAVPSSGSRGGPPSWVTNNLLTIATAAVLTIYSAGYARTRAAANRFDDETDSRRRPVPAESETMGADVRDTTPATTVDTASVAAAPASTSPTTAAVVASARTPVDSPSVTSAPVVAPPVAARVDSVSDKVAPPTPPVAPPAAPPVSNAVTATTAVDSTPAKPALRDGTFSGWGSSRHGDIQATIEIRGGKIVESYISQCLTRYPCSRIAVLPPQVLARQSSEVDYVSRATDSTNAFYRAVVDALSRAK